MYTLGGRFHTAPIITVFIPVIPLKTTHLQKRACWAIDWAIETSCTLNITFVQKHVLEPIYLGSVC